MDKSHFEFNPSRSTTTASGDRANFLQMVDFKWAGDLLTKINGQALISVGAVAENAHLNEADAKLHADAKQKLQYLIDALTDALRRF